MPPGREAVVLGGGGEFRLGKQQRRPLDAVALAELLDGRKQSARQPRLVGLGVGEKAQARGRGERRGPDQARVVGQPQAHRRLGPQLVEDEFPVGMPLEVHGQRADEPSADGGQQMVGIPALGRRGAAGILQQRQPFVFEKRRVQGGGQGVPGRAVDLGHGPGEAHGHLIAWYSHGGNIGLAGRRVTRSRHLACMV